MNTPTYFVIQLMHGDEGNEYAIIDACITEEISCGFIATESLNDLFALRDAIDAFIDKHQISRIISHE